MLGLAGEDVGGCYLMLSVKHCLNIVPRSSWYSNWSREKTLANSRSRDLIVFKYILEGGIGGF